MSTADVVRAASRHKQTTAELTNAAYIRAAGAWKKVNPGSIVSSWQILSTSIIAALMVAQTRTIESADASLDLAFNEQNIDPLDARIRKEAIVGTMPATGATLDAALAGVAYHALDHIGRGYSTNEAMQTGLVELSKLVQYGVADAGRASSQIRIGSTRQKVGYVRMASLGCCARCSVLAGRYYAWNTGFLRHPHCRCVHIPAQESMADTFATDPYEAFDALTAAEQDRIYTKAGAEAIRNGADMNQVVNSRRGMTTSGRFTAEGVGKRGYYKITSEAGRRGYSRLSVDEILRRSGSDKERFVSLLTEYGYFV
ncbi:hypothetical protein KTJ89_11310 [Brevibacterium sediminis]|uniref:VG15 protein n=1 Tax=Brevibacterium sediminis TaxID=1857024 RepID=UPI00217558E3|nr:hypothetical protein [Brevibacterium sediminis]MCS4593569.1 hypothetical protein [Brevibacterium sediminis]